MQYFKLYVKEIAMQDHSKYNSNSGNSGGLYIKNLDAYFTDDLAIKFSSKAVSYFKNLIYIRNTLYFLCFISNNYLSVYLLNHIIILIWIKIGALNGPRDRYLASIISKATIGLICPQWVGGEEGCAGGHRADISATV